MKHLLLILFLCLGSAATQAQWSRYAGRPKVSQLKFRVDSLTYYGETIAIQRFKPADLNSVLGADAHENRVALAVGKLQDQLDKLKEVMLSKYPLKFINEAETELNNIKEEGTDFNYSILEREYQLYYKHRNADAFDAQYDGSLYSKVSTRSKEQEEQAFRQEKERLEKEETKRLQDSTRAALAAEQQRIEDSTRAREEADAKQAEAKELARKDAALKKKYGVAAFSKAAKGEIWVGMTEELCLRAVGEYHQKRRVTTKTGVTEEWYEFWNGAGPLARKITFHNHVIVAIIEQE